MFAAAGQPPWPRDEKCRPANGRRLAPAAGSAGGGPDIAAFPFIRCVAATAGSSSSARQILACTFLPESVPPVADDKCSATCKPRATLHCWTSQQWHPVIAPTCNPHYVSTWLFVLAAALCLPARLFAAGWADERTAGPFHCHSQFPLDPYQPLLDELAGLQWT